MILEFSHMGIKVLNFHRNLFCLSCCVPVEDHLKSAGDIYVMAQYFPFSWFPHFTRRGDFWYFQQLIASKCIKISLRIDQLTLFIHLFKKQLLLVFGLGNPNGFQLSLGNRSGMFLYVSKLFATQCCGEQGCRVK